eukprot:834904-Amphidinium_carterae.1
MCPGSLLSARGDTHLKSRHIAGSVVERALGSQMGTLTRGYPSLPTCEVEWTTSTASPTWDVRRDAAMCCVPASSFDAVSGTQN